jgi:leucyl/phenylalanyl-tRNA--protein transferase
VAGGKPELTADLLLTGYAIGIFPMAASRNSRRLHWVDPPLRGIIPLSDFHISRSLARRIKRADYTIRTNTALAEVIEACAERDETWINTPLTRLYTDLHARGQVHSLEVWVGEYLVGGVFGVTLGGAFFGESMFSRVTDASKIALAYLTTHLHRAGFTLFDTQFLTPHLASLGAIEISRVAYQTKLAEAIEKTADFKRTPLPDAYSVLQRISQTS